MRSKCFRVSFDTGTDTYRHGLSRDCCSSYVNLSRKQEEVKVDWIKIEYVTGICEFQKYYRNAVHLVVDGPKIYLFQ